MKNTKLSSDEIFLKMYIRNVLFVLGTKDRYTGALRTNPRLSSKFRVNDGFV